MREPSVHKEDWGSLCIRDELICIHDGRLGWGGPLWVWQSHSIDRIHWFFLKGATESTIGRLLLIFANW
jgi:hypothetical protein